MVGCLVGFYHNWVPPVWSLLSLLQCDEFWWIWSYIYIVCLLSVCTKYIQRPVNNDEIYYTFNKHVSGFLDKWLVFFSSFLLFVWIWHIRCYWAIIWMHIEKSLTDLYGSTNNSLTKQELTDHVFPSHKKWWYVKTKPKSYKRHMHVYMWRLSYQDNIYIEKRIWSVAEELLERPMESSAILRPEDTWF